MLQTCAETNLDRRTRLSRISLLKAHEYLSNRLRRSTYRVVCWWRHFYSRSKGQSTLRKVEPGYELSRFFKLIRQDITPRRGNSALYSSIRYLGEDTDFDTKLIGW